MSQIKKSYNSISVKKVSQVILDNHRKASLVVADEVRNLAMRAADAAKNTANLIEGAVKKANNGSELVATTNEAFNQVAQSTAKVGELVAESSEASNEQSNGIDQVNIAIPEMGKVSNSFRLLSVQLEKFGNLNIIFGMWSFEKTKRMAI